MLVLSLRSGVGLGSFTLGCRINEALITARQNRDTFGCVELKYFEQASQKQDFILSLPEHGLHLVFNGISQRLRLIEVFDLSRVQVKQGGVTVGGVANPATCEAVYDLAGPTYPGHVDSKHEVFVMHWPGFLILFPLSQQPIARWQDMQQGKALPAALASGAAPIACRMCIHASKAVSLDELAQAGPPSAEASSEQQLGVRLGRGLVLQDTQQELCLGDTPQDAWSALGAPSSTFTKDSTSAPQGNFASPSLQQHSDAGTADYFYNYFDRGLDLLFCGTNHRLKKIVLHTNLPNHVSFGTYNKCCFLIHPPSSPTHNSTAQNTSDGNSAEKPEVTGSKATFQHAQQAQQAARMPQAQHAQHVKQVQHAQQAQHQAQHVTASCQDGGEEKHTDAFMAGDCEHERQIGKQQDSLLHHSQPPTQDLHHSQPHVKDLDHSQPQHEGVHDGQPKIEDACYDWRQQGPLPVAQWLSQADDASRCMPGPACNASGHMSGLDENPLEGAPANVQQVLLNDIMAMTRADSEAASSDSSQTRQHDLPCDANAGPSSNQALPAPGSAASPALSAEESTAQRQHLQDDAEDFQQTTAMPSVNDAWGRGSHRGSQGGPAGGSNLDGWDDMDPMALLSGSVQSQIRALESESAESPQPLAVETGDTLASQQRLPDEQLGAPLEFVEHPTNPAQECRNPVHKAPSMPVYNSDSSKSQSGCNPNYSDHQGNRLDLESHLDGHVQGNRSFLTSRTERDSGVPHVAHLSVISSSSSVGHNSTQQSVTATSLQDGDAEQEADTGAASGACPSSFEGGVSMDIAVLTAESLLADVQRMLGQGDRAVIHTRAPGRDAFGPTVVYGYPGVVFETSQAGRIASVTLF